uniref:Uncharacterized protein n=1 Tax=Hyaloperonospora arabidopsidis (strain Emoy2) TaxID=559515 RepID=M4C1Q6_HYAAE
MDPKKKVDRRRVCITTTSDQEKQDKDHRTWQKNTGERDGDDRGGRSKECIHFESTRHDDRGCWKRLTCQKCGEVRSKAIMNSEAIRTKGQGYTFNQRAPKRRSHERGQTLGEDGPAKPIKEKTVARVPVKRYRKKRTTNFHWCIRFPRVDRVP